MRIGIVGVEQIKLTPVTEEKARKIIRDLLSGTHTVVSGKCHLGGIDIIAVEEAEKAGLLFIEFPPQKREWNYYRLRNIEIARNSEYTVCLTVREYPATYKGMRFSGCYHCQENHVKSGGCWTVKYARQIGKKSSKIIVID